mgnify:CR=1 FL=1
MKVSIGFDHGALNLRSPVIEILNELQHQVTDHGTDSPDSVDYPDYARLVAEDVSSGRADMGILCCTTGIGMSIAANKVKGVRAAMVHCEDEAELTRRHNHANVLCLGGLHTTAYEAKRLIEVFLKSEPEGGRHARRVGKFSALEDES